MSAGVDTREVWMLKLSYWGLLPEGVRPFRRTSFLAEDKPGAYEPRFFSFRHKPTRSDLATVLKRTYWMNGGAFDAELDAINRSEFPLVTETCKAARVDLKDESSNVVGRIEVDREVMYENRYRVIPYIGHDDIKQVLRYVPKVKREAAVKLIDGHHRRLVERVLDEHETRQALVSEHLVCDSVIVQACLRKFLREQGIIKGKS